MRIELIILLITGILIANVYTDGKYLSKLLSYKKYYQMAGIAFGGMMAYWLFTKNPQKANEFIHNSHEYLKHLPIDQNTSNIISPILDFTRKQDYSTNLSTGQTQDGNKYSVLNMFIPQNASESRMMNSGKNSSKRSVSETKKKFVASRQNWKCGDCGIQLSAWYEVDHKIRLEYGGTNHIDNLIALCRECHGKKTTIENL